MLGSMGRVLAFATLLASLPALAVEPHRSFQRLITTNGHLVASFNRETHRVDTLLEHPYRFATPKLPDPDRCLSADETRDLAYDLFFGLRARSAGGVTTSEWLPSRAVDEASLEPGTNVIVVRQHAGPDRAIEAETRIFAPYTLDAPAMVFTLTLRNTSDAAVSVSPWFLANLHLGPANGAREPATGPEEVAWDANQLAFYEYSAQSRGTAAYVPLSPVAHAGIRGAYDALTQGANLDDVASTTGPDNDLVPALQGPDVSLAPGATTRMTVALAWAADEDAAPLVARVKRWSIENPEESLESREIKAWSDWHEAVRTPLGLRTHTALLRQAQVREPGPGFGQILASLPPGRGNIDSTWNISWVRDMAYATAALARSGHLAEARDALLFQLRAPRGQYEDYVGRPYRISLTRYFGDGREESDCNTDGPNIEYDGFGLFLWSLGEYLRAGGDLEPFRAEWSVLETEIADVLASLVDATGTIRPDSSIWEVHWNGKQRKFTFTSITGARGLCDAALVASKLGQDAAAQRWTKAGAALRDALVRNHSDRRGTLAQSTEDLARGYGYLDAATVEALNFGLVDLKGRVASATVAALRENLTVAHGRGLMRNDDGDWYDSQEWTFVDLRLASALSGSAEGNALYDWVFAQAAANDGYVAELGDPKTADALGSVPMVGFGAGALVLARLAGPNDAACGAYAPEPDPPASPDAGTATDGGAPNPEPDPGCGCGAGFPPLALVGLLARRRARR